MGCSKDNHEFESKPYGSFLIGGIIIYCKKCGLSPDEVELKEAIKTHETIDKQKQGKVKGDI